jgi:hypothetical protein
VPDEFKSTSSTVSVAMLKGQPSRRRVEERRAAIGVELLWDIALHRGEGLFSAHAFAVGAVLKERGIDVGDGDDSRFDGKLVGLEAGGIAGAIEFLVVLGDDPGEFFERLDAAKYFAAESGMFANDLPLDDVELAGFVEDGIRDAELADIVKQGRSLNEPSTVAGDAHVAGDMCGGVPDAEGMAVGEGRFGVDNIGKSLTDIVDLFAASAEHCSWLEIEDSLALHAGAVVSPKAAVRGESARDAHQLGIEPASAAMSNKVDRSDGAAVGGEEIEALGDVDDPGEQRHGLAAQPVGIAAAIPVFVEVGDGFDCSGAQADLASDVRGAFAAQTDEFIAKAAAAQRQAEDALRFREQVLAGAGVSPEQLETGYRGITPVFELDLALDGAIVPSDHLAEQVRIATAAEVFEQERVVEAGELIGGKAEFRSDPHAEKAGAGGVAGADIFGEVECER